MSMTIRGISPFLPLAVAVKFAPTVFFSPIPREMFGQAPNDPAATPAASEDESAPDEIPCALSSCPPTLSYQVAKLHPKMYPVT